MSLDVAETVRVIFRTRQYLAHLQQLRASLVRQISHYNGMDFPSDRFAGVDQTPLVRRMVIRPRCMRRVARCDGIHMSIDRRRLRRCRPRRGVAVGNLSRCLVDLANSRSAGRRSFVWTLLCVSVRVAITKHLLVLARWRPPTFSTSLVYLYLALPNLNFFERFFCFVYRWFHVLYLGTQEIRFGRKTKKTRNLAFWTKKRNSQFWTKNGQLIP